MLSILKVHVREGVSAKVHSDDFMTSGLQLWFYFATT